MKRILTFFLSALLGLCSYGQNAPEQIRKANIAFVEISSCLVEDTHRLNCRPFPIVMVYDTNGFMVKYFSPFTESDPYRPERKIIKGYSGNTYTYDTLGNKTSEYWIRLDSNVDAKTFSSINLYNLEMDTISCKEFEYASGELEVEHWGRKRLTNSKRFIKTSDTTKYTIYGRVDRNGFTIYREEILESFNQKSITKKEYKVTGNPMKPILNLDTTLINETQVEGIYYFHDLPVQMKNRIVEFDSSIVCSEYSVLREAFYSTSGIQRVYLKDRNDRTRYYIRLSESDIFGIQEFIYKDGLIQKRIETRVKNGEKTVKRVTFTYFTR